MKTVGLIPSQKIISLLYDITDEVYKDIPDEQIVVPLIKLSKPEHNIITEYCEPKLIWYEDRVERDWDIKTKTAEEIVLAKRKIWKTKTDFWNELTNSEKASIISNETIEIKLLVEELRMWIGEVWSDDSRITQGLAALVFCGIITEERKNEILI